MTAPTRPTAQAPPTRPATPSPQAADEEDGGEAQADDDKS